MINTNFLNLHGGRKMIKSSKCYPRIIPIYGPGVPVDIDRAQTITPTGNLNREKVNEIGRVGTVGYIVKTPSITYNLSQLEYGNFEFWRKLANKADDVTTITQEDFTTSAFDYVQGLKDDNGTYEGTWFYPNLRTTGFELNISDPNATVQRTFNLVGEQALFLQSAAPYLISVDMTAVDSGDVTVDCSTRIPAIDPDASISASDAIKYIYRVVRNRDGVATLLLADSDYTYSTSTHLVTIDDVEPDDMFRVWYASATAPAALFTNNDSDPAGLNADVCSIYLYVPASGRPSAEDYLYRLQSAAITAAFTREDLKEIGNKDVVQRGIKETKLTVKLGNIMETMKMEEVLRGVSSTYTRLDVSKFSTDISLIVKVYADNTKETLKYGFKLDGLSPTNFDQSAQANEYAKSSSTLEGEQITISTDNLELGDF
jgi:hypothetical protein